jgi:magnesium-transporting ATPase (P-type)
MSRQEECAVTGEVLWVVKRAIFLRQGVITSECWQKSSCSGLAHRGSQVTVSQLVFSVLAARRLQGS